MAEFDFLDITKTKIPKKLGILKFRFSAKNKFVKFLSKLGEIKFNSS
jgi:hypothetical protein